MQGDYELYTLLIASKQQMITIASDYKFSRNIVEAEFAQQKINTFSAIDKYNDAGIASKFTYSTILI